MGSQELGTGGVCFLRVVTFITKSAEMEAIQCLSESYSLPTEVSAI
jgi:hypothetical protein